MATEALARWCCRCLRCEPGGRSMIAEPGRMVRQKAGLNRSILNQGWHIFETLLSYKLEERGGHLCKVPAHDVVARTQVVLVIGCSTSDLDT